MSEIDADLEERLRLFLRRRMEASWQAASDPLLPRAPGHHRRGLWAVLGGSLGVAAIALALVLILAPTAQPAGLTRSSVIAPGKVKIEAVFRGQGRLASSPVPNWVASVADSQKWLVSTPGGQSIQVRGLEVTAAYYVANATSVKIFNEGHYSSPGAPQDVWIVVIEAPPQAGFSAISGNAVINASTRQAVEGDFFATLAKPGPSPTS